MKVALEYLLKAFFQVNNFLPYSQKTNFVQMSTMKCTLAQILKKVRIYVLR